ncbi:hypothetical protein PRUPE_2G282800 [Prunus persica]|uniref:Uncharacterized protein n=1 Tax=Prunus persica TaxID=3760 RepID=A0A251QNW4_PRUPE|nr:hypothetical protein PRUPE_2G282800 [Prunus persica]
MTKDRMRLALNIHSNPITYKHIYIYIHACNISQSNHANLEIISHFDSDKCGLDASIMRPSTGRTFILDKWKKLCMLAFGGIYHHPPLRIRWMMASKPIICKLIKMHPLKTYKLL